MQIDEAFAAEGVAPRSIVETPSAVSVCAFVRQGLGVAIVNPLTALDFIGNGLQVRPLTRSFPFRVNAVYPEHRPKSPLVDAFAAAVREQARGWRAGWWPGQGAAAIRSEATMKKDARGHPFYCRIHDAPGTGRQNNRPAP